MKNIRKTPTKEQKEWMAASGYTEAQMDAFWHDNIDTNPIVRNLHSHGMSWRDMNLSCVQQLPTQKERDLKALEEKRQKEQAERDAAEAKVIEQQYYEEHFDEIILEKIDRKENLTRSELSKLVYGYEIETDYGENRRWTRSATTIISLKGRYFSIDWEDGLTECQENEFYSQPVEVEKKTYEKTITVTEWVPKGC